MDGLVLLKGKDRQADIYECGHGERRDRGISCQIPLVCLADKACCAAKCPGVFSWPGFNFKLLMQSLKKKKVV